ERTERKGWLTEAEAVDRAREPGRELREPVASVTVGRPRGVGEPEGAHRVAEPVVPLGERGGEAAGLPAARPHVPRLCDELGLAGHGDGLEGDAHGGGRGGGGRPASRPAPLPTALR